MAEGSVKDLFDPSRMLVILHVNNPEQVLQKMQQSKWKQYIYDNQGNSITFQLDKKQVPELTTALVNGGAEIVSLQPKHSLEEYFLSLTTANQHVDHFKN